MAVRHFRLVLVVSGLLCVLAAAFGSTALDSLSGGGYTPEDSESALTQRALSERFHSGAPNLTIVATARTGVDDPSVVAAARRLDTRMSTSDHVRWAQSYWSTSDPALRSTDGRSALFLVRLTGGEDEAQRAARELLPAWQREAGVLRLAATGEAQINVEVTDQSQHDLVIAELVGAPIVGLLLLLIFRTPLAALLPLAVGAVSVVLTLAVLAVLVRVTDVSLFALNITTALGFGLAVDYSLFVVTRFREELEGGRSIDDAIVASTRLAGRTVLFSALTVAVSIAALLVFPLYYLRSLAYAAIPVVLIAALASVILLPALLRLAGRHINRWDVLSRFVGPPRSSSEGWRRLADRVMRRPLLAAAPVVVLLVLLAIPFTNAQFGLLDHRVMPEDAPAYQAAETVRRDFPQAGGHGVQVLLDGAPADQVDGYARGLSERDGVNTVVGPVATYQDGAPVAPGQPARQQGDSGWLTALIDHDPFGTQAQELVADIRDGPAPGRVSVSGDTAIMVDTKESLVDRLPLAVALIVLATLVLLFLFTGSVLIPLKAILMNTLSLTASFGAAVYIFQEGHLRWLVGDFTPTGFLEVTTPVLMFCVAFGLSMDYEVFLLSRIREQYLVDGDNTAAVATGLAKTGRLISAAAAVVAVVVLVLATSSLSVLKLLGVGLALAVVVDAILVRGVLVPALMRLLGAANWWLPRWLAVLHRKVGLREN